MKTSSEVRAVGIDETAARHGHDYVTLFHNLERQGILHVGGRDKSTVAHFFRRPA